MLYHWSSTYLQNYGPGHVIVAADSPEEARQRALAQFDAFDRERHGWMYGPDDVYDDPEEIAARRRVFEADLAKEPEVRDVLFVGGSE
jgi:alkanesulfonate monooxygenase SsuD/methylene tetrahydromethanopterin reductase-like flavin-dependent oxidoreductase (luciferase family)